jgi:hypothetical protein
LGGLKPHFFLQWASKYYEAPFPKNWEIINRLGNYRFAKGYVYWGKFHKQEDEKGVSADLESYYGEAYDGIKGRKVVENLNSEIRKANSVFLYLYNPLASDNRLHIANVLEAFYTSDGLPPDDEDERPACAHVPSYYFHEKLVEKCPSCKKRNPKCKIRFFCNFWFKVDSFKPIGEDLLRRETELNLTYADDRIAKMGTDFSLTKGQVFPILVNQKQLRDYFRPIDISQILPVRIEKPFDPHYKKGHKGEKYGSQLHKFLVNLWEKVRSISEIYVIGESHGTQVNYFCPYKDNVEDRSIIQGGRGFKSGKKNWTVVFLLYTTCKSRAEQELLVKYLSDHFLV